MARSGTKATIVYNHFGAIARKMPAAAMEIVAETLAEMDATVQTGMAAGGSGRVYIRGGVPHRASAPGAMPAKDTGDLAGSMQHEIARGKYKGYYYTNSEVGPIMEYGAPGAGILPRPFMTPAAQKARANFMRKMRNLESRLR